MFAQKMSAGSRSFVVAKTRLTKNVDFNILNQLSFLQKTAQFFSWTVTKSYRWKKIQTSFFEKSDLREKNWIPNFFLFSSSNVNIRDRNHFFTTAKSSVSWEIEREWRKKEEDDEMEETEKTMTESSAQRKKDVKWLRMRGRKKPDMKKSFEDERQREKEFFVLRSERRCLIWTHNRCV